MRRLWLPGTLVVLGLAVAVSFVAPGDPAAAPERVLRPGLSRVVRQSLDDGTLRRWLPEGWKVEGIRVARGRIRLGLTGPEGRVARGVLEAHGNGTGDTGPFTVRVEGDRLGPERTGLERFLREVARAVGNDPWLSVRADGPRAPSDPHAPGTRYLFTRESTVFKGAAGMVAVLAMLLWALALAIPDDR